MQTDLSFWIGFNVFVLLMLALDLGVFNRKAHEVSIKEAMIWTGVWITLAMCFNGLIYYWQGEVKALEFFTGYVIEKALSVDNIFVFVLIFSYFKIPAIHQHRILFWGIIGALIMRAAFIFAGVALLEKFHWTIYVFGAILIYTGYKMLKQKEIIIEPEKNPLIKLFRRVMPVTNELHGGKFFVKQDGKRFATPLFLVLVLIETTDLIFAADSIPAILAITQDHFIVYTSNVFAILGLRSLYFALAGMMDKFRYLSKGLALILIFVGLKMLLADFYKLPIQIALLVILVILILSIAASLMSRKR
ncbi:MULTISPECIES: TerC family protein [Flavobacterium]|jgi:tellurite resistance protein TerC|uniref:TerC family protein n=3 Tax=Flavobacterium TaxID=237 RepID=A0A4R5CWW4_9FLAO|nr:MULTISPECIES: TerC family protein [Flavobacterium]PIF62626.1 tellurite resistance protein TerC [Flavobacterium sp. 11]RBN49018.1 TerC family protein [Flavobacterium psychrolimnae]TDD77223.1 TerC family protein [Flavobacterium caseinilyticum]TDE04237.1 TerC family protein [Flavobacterium sandaracinum]WKL43853.1 TerC family protein [Flavobacterium sp. ZE23DGlu08]